MTTASPAERVSARALALAVDPARLRRLRITHRADVTLYGELLALTAMVLGAADGTRLALAADGRDSGLVTVLEYAQRTGLTPRAVRRACAERRLDATKRAGVWLIDATAVALREVA